RATSANVIRSFAGRFGWLQAKCMIGVAAGNGFATGGSPVSPAAVRNGPRRYCSTAGSSTPPPDVPQASETARRELSARHPIVLLIITDTPARGRTTVSRRGPRSNLVVAGRDGWEGSCARVIWAACSDHSGAPPKGRAP